MLKITEPFEWLDLQWHALDSNSHIALFRSNGGGIPLQIANVDLDEISDYFSSLPEIVDNEININPRLRRVAKLKTTLEVENYLKNNLFFARRGIFCYDKTNTTVTEDTAYHLVASPTVFLDTSNVPPFILDKLAKCRPGFDFVNQAILDISDIF